MQHTSFQRNSIAPFLKENKYTNEDGEGSLLSDPDYCIV
jgi:hypothetical protein